MQGLSVKESGTRGGSEGEGGLIVFFTQSSAGVALRFGLAERERLKQKQRDVSSPQGRLEE